MRIAANKSLMLCVVLGLCLAISGCLHTGKRGMAFPEVAHENNKTLIHDYVINPPDVLVLDLVRAVPLPPYRIKPQDLLFIQAKNVLETEPIKNVYRVEPEGIIRFGSTYGSVPVVDLTVDEAIRAIEKHLSRDFKEPKVTLSLEESRGIQLIRGEHLVRPDGTVNLGFYGRVLVAGMTQEMAKQAIEEHLSQYFLNPTISIDIGGFNSSVYYIIFDGGGLGEQVLRLPHTGSETVLDVIGQVYGLPAVASKHRVWLARPEAHDSVILPIDWQGITQKGISATNYQVFPGDRIYVAAQPIITFDTYFARLLAPVERAFGITLLGSTTVRSFRNGTNGQNFGGF